MTIMDTLMLCDTREAGARTEVGEDLLGGARVPRQCENFYSDKNGTLGRGYAPS